MKHLWLWLFPLLYLPNLGAGIPTPFGVLEISDLLIGPYLFFTLFADRQGHTFSQELWRPAAFFLIWALIGSLSIYFFYNEDLSTLHFSLLKIGKFVLYGFAALRTALLLNGVAVRLNFFWSLLGAGIVSGIAIIVLSGASKTSPIIFEALYHSMNAISLMLGILISYLGIFYLTGGGTPGWRRVAPIGFATMFVGLAFTQGRGGWLATLCAFAYYTFKQGIRASILTTFLIFAAATAVVYENSPVFRSRIDSTFSLSEKFQRKYKVGIGGVDDGARLAIWGYEFPKLAKAPLLGTGFYHRTPQTSLFRSGSHNFWLQMFLETGLVGGFMILFIFGRMWTHANRAPSIAQNFSLPTRVALIATFVGGLGGEYYYGGIVLFTFLAIYSVIGSLQNRSPGAYAP